MLLTQRSDVSGVLVGANKVECDVVLTNIVQSLHQPLAIKR